MLPEPTDYAIVKLLELKVITNSNGFYKFSTEFEESAKWLQEHKPGRFDSIKLANKINSDLAPVLITYIKNFTSKKEIELLATADGLLIKHLKRFNIDYKPEVNVIYGVYYFNDHTLKVEDAKNVMS